MIKVPSKSRSPPKFKKRFLFHLSILPGNFINIRSQLFELFCRQSDKQTPSSLAEATSLALAYCEKHMIMTWFLKNCATFNRLFLNMFLFNYFSSSTCLRSPIFRFSSFIRSAEDVWSSMVARVHRRQSRCYGGGALMSQPKYMKRNFFPRFSILNIWLVYIFLPRYEKEQCVVKKNERS